MILEKIVLFLGLLIAHFLNGSNLFEIGNDLKPDFMILFVMHFALNRGQMYGLWVGYIGGLLTDSGLGGESNLDGAIYYKIGIHSLVYSVLGYLTGRFGRPIFADSYLFITVFSFSITLISRILIYYIFYLFFYENKSYNLLYPAIYNALVGPMIFFFLSWVFQTKDEKEL